MVGFAIPRFHFLGTAIMNLFLITAIYISYTHGLCEFNYTHTCASIDEALAFANTQDYFADSITVCESY